MARFGLEPIPDEPVVQDNDALTLEDILTAGTNLADMLDTNTLNKIGQNVIRDVDIDLGSRGDWETRYERNLAIAMQTKEPKTFPWPGAANSKSPILTVAAIQFNAEAYPVIVDGSNLVKGRVLGPDPDGQKRARADCIGQHMTWQLLYRMPGWEDNTDRLLLVLPIVGCMFRKTYYDGIENANRSEIVDGLDFIINNDAKSIETAPRYTQRLHLYPYEVAGLFAAGQWIKVPVESEDGQGEDDQALTEFYEQHRSEDLDGDGFPEHYVVTCTTEGAVSKIVPCFGAEDVTVLIQGKTEKLIKVPPESMHLVERIVKIDRRQYFTKYGFIPCPDGSFYDIGFGDLLGNNTELSDTLLNQMLDAAALANVGGGFVGAGVNIRSGNFKFTLGEWKRTDSPGGMPLKDNFMSLPAPGPSPVSFSLLELLLQQAKDITSSQDVVSGKAPPNQPATTTLALIEQAGTVRKGIFKRIHRAFGQELRILRRLNRDYLDEEEYFQLNDAEEATKILREDYADEDLDVIPVSDPSQISDMHKMARAQALMQTFNGDPLINQRLIREDMLVALGARDVKKYFEVPPPAPDPKLLIEGMKQAVSKQAAESKALVDHSVAAKNLMDAAVDASSIGLVNDAAAFASEAIEIGGQGDNPEQDADTASGPGGVPGMGGPPSDAGIPPVPQGAPIGPDDGMGQGGEPSPGATGPSGAAGPVGGPQL